MIEAESLGKYEGRGTEIEASLSNEKRQAWRDKEKIPIYADGEQLIETGRTGGQDGGEPVGSAGISDTALDTERRKVLTRKILGKILARVNDLEQRHLSYVEAHEKRLEQRLIESQHSKEEAIQLIEEIRQLTRMLEDMADKEDL